MKSNLVKCIVSCLLLVAGCQNINNTATQSTIYSESEQALGLADYKKFLYWEEINAARLDHLNTVLGQVVEKGDAYQYLQVLTFFKDEVTRSKSIWKDLDFKHTEVINLREKAIEVLELTSDIVNESIQSLLQYNPQVLSQNELQQKAEYLSTKGRELDLSIKALGEKLGYLK